MRVFVTGACGFIGSRIASFLGERGNTVTGHDWSEEGDLDTASIRCEPDVVVNCAGRLGGQGFDRSELWKSNTELPENLAQFCIARGASLIHLSTPGVTGLKPDASEDDPLAPWGEYEMSKSEGEERLRLAGLPAGNLTVLRPDFVYGPGDRHKLALFRQVAKGWFPLVGNGEAIIRPTFITDVCRAVEESLPGGKLTGMTVNVGGPETVTVRNLVEQIAASMSVRVRLAGIPRFVFGLALMLGPLRPGSLTRSRMRLFGEDHYVSITRATSAGFKPGCTLTSGIEETVAWYREQGLL